MRCPRPHCGMPASPIYLNDLRTPDGWECINGHATYSRAFASEEVLRAEAEERPGFVRVNARGPRIRQTKYPGGMPAEWVRRQYVDNQLGYTAICREWKKETGQIVGKDTVKKAVISAGITPRDNATATRLKWQQVKAERLAKKRVPS